MTIKRKPLPTEGLFLMGGEYTYTTQPGPKMRHGNGAVPPDLAMRMLIGEIREFRGVTGKRIALYPEFLHADAQEMQVGLIDEELEELKKALAARDMTGVADGICDLIYVALDLAAAMGIPMEYCWAEIHGSNMEKVDPGTGLARKRADGKVLKPEGWEPPRIAAIIKAVREMFDPMHKPAAAE